MQNTVIYVSALSATLGLSTLAGVGTIDIIQSVNKPPDPRVLHLDMLDMQNGLIYQKVSVSGAEHGIQAQWNARITRPGTVGALCDGSDDWTYKNKKTGEPTKFTPDEWTLDKCPDLQAGDHLIVSFEYATEKNHRASAGGELVITKDMLKNPD